MINPGTLHLLLVSVITAACGLPLGLLLRSAAESKAGSREATLFMLDSMLGFVASLVAKMLVVVVLFFVPSLLLLHLFGHEPRSDLDMRMWVFFNLIGVGVGKLIRWLSWRRTQDLL